MSAGSVARLTFTPLVPDGAGWQAADVTAVYASARRAPGSPALGEGAASWVSLVCTAGPDAGRSVLHEDSGRQAGATATLRFGNAARAIKPGGPLNAWPLGACRLNLELTAQGVNARWENVSLRTVRLNRAGLDLAAQPLFEPPAQTAFNAEFDQYREPTGRLVNPETSQAAPVSGWTYDLTPGGWRVTARVGAPLALDAAGVAALQAARAATLLHNVGAAAQARTPNLEEP